MPEMFAEIVDALPSGDGTLDETTQSLRSHALHQVNELRIGAVRPTNIVSTLEVINSFLFLGNLTRHQVGLSDQQVEWFQSQAKAA